MIRVLKILIFLLEREMIRSSSEKDYEYLKDMRDDCEKAYTRENWE
jgi:hypothetical protein